MGLGELYRVVSGAPSGGHYDWWVGPLAVVLIVGWLIRHVGDR